jgi:hypothetical protein
MGWGQRGCGAAQTVDGGEKGSVGPHAPPYLRGGTGRIGHASATALCARQNAWIEAHVITTVENEARAVAFAGTVPAAARHRARKGLKGPKRRKKWLLNCREKS